MQRDTNYASHTEDEWKVESVVPTTGTFKLAFFVSLDAGTSYLSCDFSGRCAHWLKNASGNVELVDTNFNFSQLPSVTVNAASSK